MTDIPHFSLPFRFAGGHAVVNEQDSIDEIADCVTAVLSCPRGFRIELPAFGIIDPTFQQQPVALEPIRSSIVEWEPRAAATLTQNELDDLLTASLSLSVEVRTEE